MFIIPCSVDLAHRKSGPLMFRFVLCDVNKRVHNFV